MNHFSSPSSRIFMGISDPLPMVVGVNAQTNQVVQQFTPLYTWPTKEEQYATARHGCGPNPNPEWAYIQSTNMCCGKKP
jgi:hypothetical protein